MTDICHREGIERNQVTLHSDNGSPMKGATMLATLPQRGVIPAFSRPSVSKATAPAPAMRLLLSTPFVIKYISLTCVHFDPPQ